MPKIVKLTDRSAWLQTRPLYVAGDGSLVSERSRALAMPNHAAEKLKTDPIITEVYDVETIDAEAAQQAQKGK